MIHRQLSIGGSPWADGSATALAVTDRPQCCASVLAAPLDAADAAELAQRVQRPGRPGPAPGAQHPGRRTRRRGVRVRLRRAVGQEPAHGLPSPEDPERGGPGPRRPAGQVGLVLAQSCSPGRAPGGHRQLSPEAGQKRRRRWSDTGDPTTPPTGRRRHGDEPTLTACLFPTSRCRHHSRTR